MNKKGGAHQLARAKERYGVDWNAADLKAITQAIQQNLGQLDGRQDSGHTTWRLEYKGVPIRVVVDPTFYYVVTFLPLHKRLHTNRKRIWRGGRAEWVEIGR